MPTPRVKTAWPDRLLAFRYVQRATVYWTAVHVFFLVTGGGQVVALDPLAALAVVAISGWLGLFDAKRRDETLLLQNMGVNPALVSALWISACIVLEVLANVLAATLRR